MFLSPNLPVSFETVPLLQTVEGYMNLTFLTLCTGESQASNPIGSGLGHDNRMQWICCRSYCEAHRPVQAIDLNGTTNMTCSICMEEIEGEISSEYVLRSPCCKTALYHKECIQVGSTSSLYGYFNTVHKITFAKKI